eukprot:409316-Rhodomonas_salina.1
MASPSTWKEKFRGGPAGYMPRLPQIALYFLTLSGVVADCCLSTPLAWKDPGSGKRGGTPSTRHRLSPGLDPVSD